MDRNRDKTFEELMEKLYALAALMSKNSHPKQYGSDDWLYLFEVHTLKMVYEHPGLSLGELAEMSYRTKGAMSLMIDKLVDKGLVIKRKSAVDVRRYEIDPTEKGRAVGAFHEAYDREHYGKIIERMPEELAGGIGQADEVLGYLVSYIAQLRRLNS